MKIVDMRVRTVAIPLTCQLRHNTGVHPGYFLRTVLELITDEGIVGLGEVGGGDQRGALTKLKPRIIGLDPFHLEVIKLKVLRSIYYLVWTFKAKSSAARSPIYSAVRCMTKFP
jgi:glucarate dehydratase